MTVGVTRPGGAGTDPAVASGRAAAFVRSALETLGEDVEFGPGHTGEAGEGGGVAAQVVVAQHRLDPPSHTLLTEAQTANALQPYWSKAVIRDGVGVPSNFERTRESNGNSRRNISGVYGGVPRGEGLVWSRWDSYWNEKGTPSAGTGRAWNGSANTTTAYERTERTWYWPDQYTVGEGILDFAGSIYTNSGLEWLGNFSVDVLSILSVNPLYVFGAYLDYLGGSSQWDSSGTLDRIVARRDWLRANGDNLFRVAGGAFDMIAGASFGWTGFGGALFTVGLDQFVFGMKNLIDGSHAATPIEGLFTELTGSATVGQLAPGVLSLGLWGAGRWTRSALLADSIPSNLRSILQADESMALVFQGGDHAATANAFRLLRYRSGESVIRTIGELGSIPLAERRISLIFHGNVGGIQFGGRFYPAADLAHVILNHAPHIRAIELIGCFAANRYGRYGMHTSFAQALANELRSLGVTVKAPLGRAIVSIEGWPSVVGMHPGLGYHYFGNRSRPLPVSGVNSCYFSA
jgi:hypothetical protein